MSHRRIKNIDFDDDDDLDEYDEDDYGEEELSPEDQEQMRQGKTKVREALGPDYANVGDKQIEDALWNYYYDIGKSVAYLKNAHKPAQTKKAKQPSRFDQAASSAAQAQPKQANVFDAYPLLSMLPTLRSDSSPANFFDDTPWLNVPINRRGTLTPARTLPRMGLLGGSSKIAALAAARRKKQEEARSNSAASPAEDARQQTGRAVALLDSLSNKASSGSQKNQGQASTGTSQESAAPKPNAQARLYPRRKRSPSPVKPEPVPEAPKVETKKRKASLPDIRAGPSVFAKTMFGSTPRGQLRGGETFSLPFKRIMPQDAQTDPFAGPSPDDEVLNKQAKAFKKSNTTGNAANKKDKDTGAVTKGVANLTVDDAPRVKSKNLNVLEEYKKSNLKPSANFVVIGHVDHGKSTLMGRLLYDLKVVDERSIEKLRKEAQNMGKSSFALAWVMDATSEERSRGVTVDIATNTFETEKTRFTILDAPGHQDFVPNMIAGASQADFAVLVIDASANSFESGLRGQTKEHALLARSIGVQQLIIAVNKMDAASWSKERYDEISQQMAAFLTSANFQPQNLKFVPCAGLTGQNVAHPVPKDVAPWYDGPSLVQALEASEVSKRAVSGPLRVSISDIFRGDITSAVSVAGRIDSGSLQVGDAVVTLPRPAGETGTAFIKGIMVDDEPADWAVAGQIPTLHLTNIDPDQLRLGDVVCHPANAIKSITTFTAKILAFEHVMPMFVEVHKGRWNMEGRITKLLAILDKNSGEVIKTKPRVIQPGTVAKVEVQLDRAVPLETAQRVVLRNEGLTVAAALLEEVR
ncbi:uncharacterized protein IWZ02DRAFT_489218 [Phyllosticta citriasiana]|uniref:Elongation factor 1-alpha n=1 Tax=Phyllosticta citriasiana TaxID=595635 RepID=A0ABR1KN37_9PEZI